MNLCLKEDYKQISNNYLLLITDLATSLKSISFVKKFNG